MPVLNDRKCLVLVAEVLRVVASLDLEQGELLTLLGKLDLRLPLDVDQVHLTQLDDDLLGLLAARLSLLGLPLDELGLGQVLLNDELKRRAAELGSTWTLGKTLQGLETNQTADPDWKLLSRGA